MKNKILFYIIFFFTVILYAQSNEDCWTLINNGVDIYNGQYNNSEYPGYHDPETTDLEEVNGGFLTTGQYNKQTFDSNDNNIYTNLEDKDGGYLTKHDYNGNLKWIVYTEKNVNSYRDVMFGSVEDNEGNIYVIGHSINGAFFDSQGTEITFNSSSLYGGFIVKLNENGEILWHIVINNVYSKKINIDDDGNILLSGDVNIYNNNTFNFYLNGTITDNLLNFETMGNNSNYVNRGLLKINPEGNLLWYTGIKTSGPNNEFLIDIGSDINNNIYVTGYCSFNAEIYSAGDTNNPNIIAWIGNSPKTFLIKFDKDGQFIWNVKSRLNDPVNNGVTAFSTTVDEQGNSYITGSNDSRSNNSPDQIFENTDGSITSEHVGTFFIAKVNTNGICEWIKGAADSYGGPGYKVIKSNDEIIVVGSVQAFQFLPEEVEFLSSDGNNIEALFYPDDYFLAIYDTDGNLNRVVSSGINYQHHLVTDRISGFFKDSNDNYYISRNIWFYINGPQDYENFGHIINAQSLNGRDGTITKFREECGIIIGNVINQNVPNLSFCDNTSVGTDTDGQIEFDLTQHEEDILIVAPTSDFQFNYYSDSLYTVLINNPSEYQNTNQTETIYVDVINSTNPENSGQTSFMIEVFEKPTVTPIVELKQCDDDIDGFSVFNLEEVIDEITTNASSETITFHELLSDAETGDNPIPNPTTYENGSVSSDVVWASIKNANDCIRTSQVNLFVSTTQIPLTFATRNFYECDDDVTGTITDGISSFDFSTVTTEIETLFPVGQQLVITYYRNLADALSENNSIIDITDYRNIGYPNTQNIYIRVDSLLDNDCLGLGSHITLHVETIPVVNPITLADECDDDGDGLFAFDSSNYESTIIGSQTNVNVIYIDQNGITLPSPLPNPFLTGTQTITVRVENALSQDSDGACFDETTISFSVDAAAVANPITDFIECDDDIDGLFSFDTSTIESTVLNGQTGMIVSYTDSNGTLLPSPLPNPFLTGTQTITVRVENPLNTICFDETTFEFIVRERPEFELIDENVICINNNPTLDITTYNWTGPNGFTDTGESTTVSEGGIYTVIATSSFGCDSFPQEIIINESELATITLDMITIVDDSTNNTVTIDSYNLGFGEYEFSLDDEFGIYQDEPFFDNVPAGIHKIYVRDKNDCGTSQLEISVIGYPKFFTPNNDGENDTWQILGVNSDFYPNSIIHIYDRFGKIVANVSPTSGGWDGYFNGKLLPSTDYWFSVQLVSIDGTSTNRQGNFSLVRR